MLKNSLFAALTIAASVALGAPQYYFNYQGRLTDPGGVPLAGSHKIWFTIFSGGDANGPAGEKLFSESAMLDAVGGVISHAVGTGNNEFGGPLTPEMLAPKELMFLQIAIDDEANVLLPRLQFSQAPHAIVAFDSMALGGVAPSGYAPSSHSHDGAYWKLGGNGGTSPGTHFIGTTDNQALEMKVNGLRVARYEPALIPNVILGHPSNGAAAAVYGATIGGGGTTHTVTANLGTVAGGFGNTAGEMGAVGGGAYNTTREEAATVAGGFQNEAEWEAAVCGGNYNMALGGNSSIVGGFHNTASGDRSAIGGGGLNIASGYAAGIGSGEDNQATLDVSWVGGGSQNRALEGASCIGGGMQNQAGGLWSTIAGGQKNMATGEHSAIPGGKENVARGARSLAAGTKADAYHDGAFVWADGTDAKIHSDAANQFVARANGGFWLGAAAAETTAAIPAGHFIETTANGAYLSTGGMWTNGSDRNAKTGYEPVSAAEVLRKLVTLPISTWSYRSEDPSVRHIGPTAQDFKSAFGVGQDERHIGTVDADGVALAAIQGIYGELASRDAHIAEQDRTIRFLEQRLKELERKVEKTASHGQPPQP